MARRMPINCHKMRKRILCMQMAVGVGDLQGSFFPHFHSQGTALQAPESRALATLLE